MDTGTDNDADPATERVRRELARLGRDGASAPEVPAEVTARIAAALRAAPAHSVPRPRLPRGRLIALVIGLLAVLAALAVGASMLLQTPSSRFPAGPTAQTITVDRPAFPVAERDVLALLSAPPDYGPLTDHPRRAACLDALGYPASAPVLGARSLPGDGVVLVLQGKTPQTLTALLVEPDCGAGHSGLRADTEVRRP